MAPLLLLIALTNAVPTMDLASICRGERSGVPADQQEGVYQGCLRDEAAARDRLTKEWAQYPVAARVTCAALGREVLSYVEVLTCIEIKTGNASSQSKSP